MKLAFYFTLTCTARCDHCITIAGPKVRRKMTLEDARAVVASVARVPQLDGIVFTGGENFIHRDELLELVRDCTALGLRSEVITNAFWATSPSAAREALAPFREAGLGLVRISVDRFHLPYVSTDRVHTALAALKDAGFQRHVTCVVEQPNAVYKKSILRDVLAANPRRPGASDDDQADVLTRELQHGWPPDLIQLLHLYEFDLGTCFLIDDAVALREESAGEHRALAEQIAAGRTLLQYQFLATEGRGRMLLGSVADKHVDDIPETVCNSVMLSPTITPEGNVFPCCSSWVNHKHQAIGNVHEESLNTLLQRVNADPVALFMYYQGPAALVRYLRAQRPQAVESTQDGRRRLRVVSDATPPLPDRYTHPCHLCGTLLETYSREELEASIRAYYDDNPWRLLVSNRGVDLMVAADVAPA
jgi:hypothetical protein